MKFQSWFQINYEVGGRITNKTLQVSFFFFLILVKLGIAWKEKENEASQGRISHPAACRAQVDTSLLEQHTYIHAFTRRRVRWMDFQESRRGRLRQDRKARLYIPIYIYIYTYIAWEISRYAGNRDTNLNLMRKINLFFLRYHFSRIELYEIGMRFPIYFYSCTSLLPSLAKEQQEREKEKHKVVEILLRFAWLLRVIERPVV